MSLAPFVVESVAQARTAHASWRQTAIAERLRIIREVRRGLTDSCEDFALAASSSTHPPEEVMFSEVLPLLEACKFLERSAAKLLAPQRLGRGGRPLWLSGVASVIHREPFGVIGIISPSNYPLFLAGVQILQALVAGNGVVWKPAPSCAAISRKFIQLLCNAGVPSELIRELPDTLEAGISLTQSAIDKLVFTGGFENGTKVLDNLSQRAVPAIVELSGCDPVFVRADADLEVVAKALQFGTTLNQGRTCMAPRRVFVGHQLIAALETKIKERFSRLPQGLFLAANTPQMAGLIKSISDALRLGGRLVWGEVQPSGIRFPCVLADVPPNADILKEDLFAPIVFLTSVESDDAAVAASATSGFGLAASVFSKDLQAAEHMCGKISAGLISVNDLIVPSADPRIPFGGSRKSGYGVTRGGEGLLSLTQVKVVQVRRGGSMQHLEAKPIDLFMAGAITRLLHGSGLRAKISACVAVCKMGWRLSAKVKEFSNSEDSR